MTSPFEKRACLAIFVFQLIGVLLSIISIIYFVIAVYIPSQNSLNAKDFPENEVTCISLSNANRTIESSVNRKGKLITDENDSSGSSIRLEGCNPETFQTALPSCPKTGIHACIKGECANLHGLFNCTVGPESPTGEIQGSICKNVTSALSCNLTTTDAPIICNTRKACLRLHGLVQFIEGEAARIRPPFECKKLCSNELTTYQEDVIIIQKSDNEIYTGNCERALDGDTGLQIWPTSYPQSWEGQPPMLVVSCEGVTKDPTDNKAYELNECGNGDLVEPEYFRSSVDIKKVLEGEYNIFGRLVRFDMEWGSENKETYSWFQCFESGNGVLVQFGALRAVMGLMIAAVVPFALGVVCYCMICTFTKSGKAGPKNNGVMK